MKKYRWLITIITCLLVVLYGSINYLLHSRTDMKVDYTPAEKKCFSVEKTIPWKYCIYTARQGTNGNVAYHLHGRDLDENAWNDDTYYTSIIQKIWEHGGVKPPTVVSISFGPLWLLTPKNSLPKTGLLEEFQKEVIPEVESHTGIPRVRILFGESMGGLNTLITTLLTENLFNRTLALCPPLYKASPFMGLGEIQKFLSRTGADPRTILGIIFLAKQYVANDEEWRAISPIDLLEKADPKKTAQIYLSCGLYDKYGNFEGAEYFAERALKRGFNLSWHPIYGGHCAIDVDSVAYELGR